MSIKTIPYSLLILILPLLVCKGQEQNDSIQFQVQTAVLGSQNDYLPHYLHSNRNGILDYDTKGLYEVAGIKGVFRNTEKSRFDYGLKFVSTNRSSFVHLQELYAEYNWKNLSFFAGKREKETDVIETISVGEFGISQNARPIPKVGVEMKEYWTLPIRPAIFSIKGSFYHGWMEADRYVESALLHQKSVYARIGNEKMVIGGGLNHFAVWGGTVASTGEKLYQGFSDFFDVFFGRGRENLSGGESNGVGNHLGFWNFHLRYVWGKTDIELYTDLPFEDGRSWQFWNLDENKDRLVGLKFKIDNSESKAPIQIDGISLQYMTTKFQQGPGLPDEIFPGVENFGYQFGGRDDTYNNFLYRDGWTYFNRPIGNPLFTERTLGRFYFGDFEDYGVAIVNNRIQAVHVGVSGRYRDIKLRMLATFSQNFGTYSGLYEGRFSWEGIQTDPNFEYVFLSAPKQNYFMAEAEFRPFRDKHINVSTTLAIDSGEMTNNFGGQLAVSYTGLLWKN